MKLNMSHKWTSQGSQSGLIHSLFPGAASVFSTQADKASVHDLLSSKQTQLESVLEDQKECCLYHEHYSFWPTSLLHSFFQTVL